MSNGTLESALPADPARTRDWLALQFALTVFVSAFWLFQIEPLISKFILPWFGGSPAVWTTCLLFLQVVLFCGYAYAHFSTRFLAPRVRVLVHCALLGLALVFLHVAPGEQYKPLTAADPTFAILGLLAATVGLPYFALSATRFSRNFRGRFSRRGHVVVGIGLRAAAAARGHGEQARAERDDAERVAAVRTTPRDPFRVTGARFHSSTPGQVRPGKARLVIYSVAWCAAPLSSSCRS